MIRLLHVEDDEEVSNLVADALTGHARVDGAFSLNMARGRLTGSLYDVLLVDLTLPDARDVEAVIALRSYGIPIVVLSGAGDGEILCRAARAGAVDYLTKPVRRGELVDRVTFVHTRYVETVGHPITRYTTVGRRIGETAFERLKPFISCESRAPFVVA